MDETVVGKNILEPMSDIRCCHERDGPDHGQTIRAVIEISMMNDG